MLRVTDARKGEPVDLAVDARPLRITVRIGGTDDGLGATALRTALAGDVLARAAELAGRPVLTAHQVTERHAAELARAVEQLRLRPAEAALGGPADVTVAAGEVPDPEGVLLAVGEVRGQVRIPPGVDALALRLALLRHPRHEPFSLIAGEVADAEVQLGRWRRKVAEWANRPSRAIPDELRQRCDAALAQDLDVPAVLRLLDEVENGGVPEGARFELFSFADRVLALELVREIGRW
jgi:hypothetical protein